MSFGIDHQVGSVVVFASLVLTFITQAALMDIYLIYYLHPVALWILLVGDTAVLGHLVWSAYPSQTADHAAVSWVEEKFRKLSKFKIKICNTFF